MASRPGGGAVRLPDRSGLHGDSDSATRSANGSRRARAAVLSHRSAPERRAMDGLADAACAGRWRSNGVGTPRACGETRSLRAEVLLERHADDVLEALCERFDRAARLIEKDAFDAEERNKHRDQAEVRLVLASDLTEPVFERVQVDGPHGDPGRRKRAEHAEELLLRVDQIEDDQRGNVEAFDHSFSLSSINTPFPADGWRNATRQPCAPGTGASLISRNPRFFKRARCSSRWVTRRQMWWIPSPRLAMKRPMGESSDKGSRSSRLESPTERNEVRTPCDSTVST